MSTEPTGPWVEPMKRAKAVDPRNGLPSWNRLAELAGVSTTTITGMISGARKTSAGTIQSVAEVLRVDPEDVSAWLALTRPVRKAYAAPPEASLLTDRQQAALTAFIRALVAEEQEAGTGSWRDASSEDDTPTEGPPLDPFEPNDARNTTHEGTGVTSDEVSPTEP